MAKNIRKKDKHCVCQITLGIETLVQEIDKSIRYFLGEAMQFYPCLVSLSRRKVQTLTLDDNLHEIII